jgi:hypothetical protein
LKVRGFSAKLRGSKMRFADDRSYPAEKQEGSMVLRTFLLAGAAVAAVAAATVPAATGAGGFGDT